MHPVLWGSASSPAPTAFAERQPPRPPPAGHLPHGSGHLYTAGPGQLLARSLHTSRLTRRIMLLWGTCTVESFGSNLRVAVVPISGGMACSATTLRSIPRAIIVGSPHRLNVRRRRCHHRCSSSFEGSGLRGCETSTQVHNLIHLLITLSKPK